MSNEYKKIASEIQSIFNEMDEVNERFSKKYAISCSSSCLGKCCDDHKVEVSPTDLIPLALEICENNQEEYYLKLLKEKANSPCIFYNNGKCSNYPKRAVLCRLFGFAKLKSKNGISRLSICKEITNEYTHPIAKSNADEAVSLVDYSSKVSNFKPEWQHIKLPINQALLFCLEHLYSDKLYANNIDDVHKQ